MQSIFHQIHKPPWSYVHKTQNQISCYENKAQSSIPIYWFQEVLSFLHQKLLNSTCGDVLQGTPVLYREISSIISLTWEGEMITCEGSTNFTSCTWQDFNCQFGPYVSDILHKMSGINLIRCNTSQNWTKFKPHFLFSDHRHMHTILAKLQQRFVKENDI